MKNAIFYYTSNFLSRKLLASSVKHAMKQAYDNGCKLVITSHYPLIKNYKEIDIKSDDITFKHVKSVPNEMQDFVIKDLRIDTYGDVVNYVFPTLPYSAGSILKQLIYSCKNCNCDNAILFEHDCFYPVDYISSINDGLSDVDMTFCVEKYTMLNEEGFYNSDPHIFLSSFAARVNLLGEVFSNKLELFKKKKGEFVVLEPIVPWDLVLDTITNSKGLMCNKYIRLKTKETKGLPLKGNLANNRKGEIIIENCKSIDDILAKDHSVLEIQHGLNTSPSLPYMRKICNRMSNEKYSQCFIHHPYWGHSKKYIDKIKYKHDNTKNWQIASNIGLHHLNLRG